MSTDEMEKYRNQDRQEEAGTCIMGEMRKDREEPDWYPDGITFKEKYEKERKLRQEAEGELTIIKGIGNTSPEMKSLKKEIKNLKWINDHDYIFLVDENKKLHKELRELKEDNKKLAHEINDRIARAREAGL